MYCLYSGALRVFILKSEQSKSLGSMFVASIATDVVNTNVRFIFIG